MFTRRSSDWLERRTVVAAKRAITHRRRNPHVPGSNPGAGIFYVLLWQIKMLDTSLLPRLSCQSISHWIQALD